MNQKTKGKSFSIFLILILTMTFLPIASAEEPGAPTNLCATALGPDSIRLTWNHVDGADYYLIYWINEGRMFEIGFADYSPEYTITDLNSDTTYTYRVSAVIGMDEGRKTEVSARTEKLPGPLNVVADAVSAEEIIVTWDAVYRSKGYAVYRSLAEFRDENYVLVVYTEGMTEFTDTGLTPDTAYYYKIAAYEGDPRSSDYKEGELSDPAHAITFGSLGIPNPSAEAQNMSSIEVTWDEIPDAMGYNVYRSTYESGWYSQIGFATSTNFEDTGLEYDTTYYYKVSAVNGNGEGERSNPTYATTHKPQTIDLSATALSTSEIRLEWTPINGATYEIYRSTYPGGGYAYLAFISAGQTGLTDIGLTASTTYYYKIVASNGAEAYASATTYDGSPVLTATPMDTQSIQLDWIHGGYANQYNIYRSLNAGGPFNVIDTVGNVKTYTDMNLESATTYYYKVAAYNGVEGGHSNIASATTLKPAIGVPDVTAEALNTSSIKVTWNEITGAQDYNIYRSLTENDGYKVVGVVDATEKTELIDTGLDHSTTYFYKVAAYDGVDMGEQSAPASATTKTPEASKPSNPGSNGGSKTVKEEAPAAEISGYEIPELEPTDLKMSGAGAFPLFLLMLVLTIGILYVRARRRAKNLQ